MNQQWVIYRKDEYTWELMIHDQAAATAKIRNGSRVDARYFRLEVQPIFRKKGLGTKLLTAVIDDIRREHIKVLEAVVEVDSAGLKNVGMRTVNQPAWLSSKN